MAEEPNDDLENDDEYVKFALMEGGTTVGSRVSSQMKKVIWILWFVFLGLYFFI